MFAQVGIAATLAVASYALVNAGALAATQRLDPQLQSLVRNRYIAGALGVVGGLFLARKEPLYGAGVAAGALVAIGGMKAYQLVGSVIEKKADVPIGDYESMAAVYGNLGGYAPQMGAYASMGAVYGNMGAVYGNLGDPSFVPAPNWEGNPF
jgi:hypothetical protein